MNDYQTIRLSLKAHPMRFLREHYAAQKFVTADRLHAIRDGKRVSMAGLVLIRQRPGSAKGVCFITLEDETGIANLVVWPDVFDKQRKIVMGARLMAVHGIIQKDAEDGVIHVVARKLEDHTHMLRHLSDEAMPSTLNQGDGAGSWRPPAGPPSARRRNHPQEHGISIESVRFPTPRLRTEDSEKPRNGHSATMPAIATTAAWRLPQRHSLPARSKATGAIPQRSVHHPASPRAARPCAEP